MNMMFCADDCNIYVESGLKSENQVFGIGCCHGSKSPSELAREPTLFLARRDEVSFEEVHSLLKHAFLGARAMGNSIDVGLNGPPVLMMIALSHVYTACC